jgi:hypothetical protein
MNTNISRIIIMDLPPIKIVTLDEIKTHGLNDLLMCNEYLAVYCRDVIGEHSGMRYGIPYDEVLMLRIQEICGDDMEPVGSDYDWNLRPNTKSLYRNILQEWQRVSMYHFECADKKYVVIWRTYYNPMKWVERHNEIELIIERHVRMENFNRCAALQRLERKTREASWLYYLFGYTY